MAEQFKSPSTEGKPFVPAWDPPPTTKLVDDFAKLHTIDLSLLDSPDPQVVADLVAVTKTAIRDDGFLFLSNFGVSLDQLHRQFALAQYLHRNMSDEDKEKLLWDPSTGRFAGYKHPYGWKRERSTRDGIEQFNFYAPQFEDVNKVPTCIHPFMDEISAFCTYLTKNVNRRLLLLLSRALEMPDDFLWNHVQSHSGPVDQGYFRHALFRPLDEQTRKAGGGMRMNGHTDQGTTTMLFSVPVSCLQIWGKDQKWRYAEYKPGCLVINLGEVLDIVSGGHFKATRHRVYQPPEDQAGFERLSLVLFNAAEGDLRMEPAWESPLLQREGVIEEEDGIYAQYASLVSQGMPVPTNKQWREVLIANMNAVADNSKLKVVEVKGSKMYSQKFFGVEVLLPL